MLKIIYDVLTTILIVRIIHWKKTYIFFKSLTRDLHNGIENIHSKSQGVFFIYSWIKTLKTIDKHIKCECVHTTFITLYLVVNYLQHFYQISDKNYPLGIYWVILWQQPQNITNYLFNGALTLNTIPYLWIHGETFYLNKW